MLFAIKLLICLIYVIYCAEELVVEKTRQYQEVSQHHAIKCGRQLGDAKSHHIYGEFCCAFEMEEILANVRPYPDELLGDTAKRLQHQLQGQYGFIFDVIISREDFVGATHFQGTWICKLHVLELYVLAYKNRGKSNISDTDKEEWFAGIDAQEPLGSTLHTAREDWPDLKTDPLADLGAGTHCVRQRRTGNKCCSKALYQLMVTVVDQVATSPVFNSSMETPGILANGLKKRVQGRFSRVFEIFVSKENFVQATYSIGNFFCKIQREGVFLLAYETPRQSEYNSLSVEEEDGFSSLTDSDPLGTTASRLPGQKMAAGVPLETEGYRLGFPKDSHCDHDRRDGMKCCHMDLFTSLHEVIQEMMTDDSFQSLDRRTLAKKLKNTGENKIQEPLELVISDGQFVTAGQEKKINCTCHFKADGYHIMVWRTAGAYPIGVEMFADNGRSQTPRCGRNHAGGGVCCNKEHHFDLIKQLNQLDTSMNTNDISRAIIQQAQTSLNIRMEVVVGLGSFHFQPGTASQICTIDHQQHHVLIYPTGGAPLPGEFEKGDVQDSLSPVITVLGEPAPHGPNIVEANNAEATDAETGEADENSDADGNDNNGNKQNQDSQQSQAQSSMNNNNDGNDQRSQSQVQSPPQDTAQIQAILQAPAPIMMPSLLQAVPGPLQGFAAVAGENGFAAAVAAGACFSGNTLVETSGGSKKLEQVGIGQLILTTGPDEQLHYIPIKAWLHREPETEAVFYAIKTRAGHQLHLTPKHLIYRIKCRGNVDVSPTPLEMAFAADVRTGDCLQALVEGKVVLTVVVDTRRVSMKGIYAPLTANGKFFASGLMASCYSELDKIGLIETYYWLVRQFGWSSDEMVQLPYLYNLLLDIATFSSTRRQNVRKFTDNFNDYSSMVPDNLLVSPMFLEFAERLKNLQDPPYIIMFDIYDFEMVKNHICNLKYYPRGFERLAGVALDAKAEMALRQFAPEIPVVTLGIALAKIPPTIEYREFLIKQLIFVLRARISRVLSQLGISFWMMQQDTIWIENFAEMSIEAKYSNYEMLFDNIGNENFYEYQTWAEGRFCGSTYFVRGSSNSAKFFQNIEAMLLTKPWYADSAVMTYFCGRNGYKCGIIPKKEVSCSGYFYTDNTDSPAIIQMDIMTKEPKLQLFAKNNMSFVKEGKCYWETIKTLKDTVLYAFKDQRKPLPHVPFYYLLYHFVARIVRWDFYGHHNYLRAYEELLLS